MFRLPSSAGAGSDKGIATPKALSVRTLVPGDSDNNQGETDGRERLDECRRHL